MGNALAEPRPGPVRTGSIAALRVVLLLGGAAALAAPPVTPESIANAVDPLILQTLRQEGIPGAAFVFVRGDSLLYAQGYGSADVDRKLAVNVEETVWPIASITKLFTGVAALQLVGDGELSLEEDINRSLRLIEVPAQGHAPITLAHLLAHTSGLDELPGRQFDPEAGAAPRLAEFLETRLKRYRAPGVSTAYSSYGIALVGAAIEEASGLPYEEYVRRRILEPCGMRRSWIMARRGDETGVATPYAIENGRAARMPHEWYVTTPTSSLVATATDMARFAMLHLADGRCDGRQILSARLARAMRTQQSTVHPALPGWGYAFQIDVENGLRLAEHGGDIGGFSALFTLIPERRSAFFIVHHGEGGDLRFRVRSALLDALYPERTKAVAPRPDPASVPKLREYAGRYRSSIACRTCAGRRDEDFELTVGEEGVLELWGQKWVPLAGKDLFIRTDGERLLGFSRDAQGRILSVSAGSWRVADRVAD